VSEEVVRFFAFIRAINVGGRRLTNDDLIAPFLTLGLDEVAAYQAAGNVTFVTDKPQIVSSGTLSDALSTEFGFAAPTFVRTETDLLAAVQAHAFEEKAVARTEGRIQIVFMHETPSKDAITEAMDLIPEGDRVTFSGREWFWLPQKGVSDSTLPVAKVENIVGPMTMRTLGTVNRMLKRFGRST